jgi:hypothetical protein
MKNILFSTILLALFSCEKNEKKKDDELLPSDEFLIGAGGKFTDLVNDMVVEKNENIYLIGNTLRYNVGDSVHFGNKIIKSPGDEDAFVVKYDPKGNAIWAKLLGSTGKEEGLVIAADGNDNCYIAGTFGGQTNFGSTILTPEVISNPNGMPNQRDMFLAKYDPQGKEIWVKQISGLGYEIPTSIVTDKSGNLFVSGYFFRNAKFAGTTLVTPGPAIFVAKYTSNGTLLWAKSYGASPFGSLYANNLKLDNNDNLIIVGSFDGPHNLGSHSIQSKGNQDVFTAKLDNNGNVQWVTTFGGLSAESCYALAIDNANNFYIGGMFSASVTIGNYTINSTGNGSDAYFAKFTSAGNVEWIKSASGNGDETVHDMYILKDTLYSVGYFTKNFLIENRVISTNSWHAFITKHDLAGGLSGFNVMNLNIGYPQNIHFNQNDYCIISGNFNNTISFENMGITSKGGYDMFLLKKKLTFK